MKTLFTLALASAVLLSTAAYAQNPALAPFNPERANAPASPPASVASTLNPAAPSFTLSHDPTFTASSTIEAAAGLREPGAAPNTLPMPDGNPHCVGPVSYCNIFAGS